MPGRLLPRRSGRGRAGVGPSSAEPGRPRHYGDHAEPFSGARFRRRVVRGLQRERFEHQHERSDHQGRWHEHLHGRERRHHRRRRVRAVRGERRPSDKRRAPNRRLRLPVDLRAGEWRRRDRHHGWDHGDRPRQLRWRPELPGSERREHDAGRRFLRQQRRCELGGREQRDLR